MRNGLCNISIGQHLRAARVQLELRQEDVAKKAGLSILYYGKIERGEVCPSLNAMDRICSVLMISISDVLSEAISPKED